MRARTLCCLLGLALMGCGSSTGGSTGGGVVPAIVAPAATTVPPRFDGFWTGTLPDGDRLEFNLEQADDHLVIGNGLRFHGNTPEALDIEGTLAGSEALLQLVSIDEGSSGQDTDLTLQLFPNGSAQAELEDGQTFPLAQPARLEGLARLWDNSPSEDPETYRVVVRNDFNEEFYLRVSFSGPSRNGRQGTWEVYGGRIPLWTFTKGEATGQVYDNGQWIVLNFLHGGNSYGQVVFPRVDDAFGDIGLGLGDVRFVERSDSLLRSKSAFGWVQGTAELETP